MRIDDRHYRVSILVLCMQDEVDVTLLALGTLLPGIEDDTTISVLLNGGDSAALRDLAANHDCLRYYRVDRNLGVAGGRNFLLRTEECARSDIVLILDNDVIAPVDYVRRIAAFLVAHEDAGVVGAAVADIKQVMSPAEFEQAGSGKLVLTSGEIRRRVAEGLAGDMLYHVGVCSDYRYAYFSVLPRLLQLFGNLKPVARAAEWLGPGVTPMLKSSAAHLRMLRDGVAGYEVSNVAGCSQAFRRELVARIGYLDERFNPYGFEDVDFCIRAMRSGRRNYISGNTWLLHGTDNRHKQRDRLGMMAGLFRGRMILASRVFGNTRAKLVMLKIMFVFFVLDFPRSPRMALRELRSRIRGFTFALAALGAAAA